MCFWTLLQFGNLARKSFSNKRLHSNINEHQHLLLLSYIKGTNCIHEHRDFCLQFCSSTILSKFDDKECDTKITEKNIHDAIGTVINNAKIGMATVNLGRKWSKKLLIKVPREAPKRRNMFSHFKTSLLLIIHGVIGFIIVLYRVINN